MGNTSLHGTKAHSGGITYEDSTCVHVDCAVDKVLSRLKVYNLLSTCQRLRSHRLLIENLALGCDANHMPCRIAPPVPSRMAA